MENTRKILRSNFLQTKVDVIHEAVLNEITGNNEIHYKKINKLKVDKCTMRKSETSKECFGVARLQCPCKINYANDSIEITRVMGFVDVEPKEYYANVRKGFYKKKYSLYEDDKEYFEVETLEDGFRLRVKRGDKEDTNKSNTKPISLSDLGLSAESIARFIMEQTNKEIVPSKEEVKLASTDLYKNRIVTTVPVIMELKVFLDKEGNADYALQAQLHKTFEVYTLIDTRVDYDNLSNILKEKITPFKNLLTVNLAKRFNIDLKNKENYNVEIAEDYRRLKIIK